MLLTDCRDWGTSNFSEYFLGPSPSKDADVAVQEFVVQRDGTMLRPNHRSGTALVPEVRPDDVQEV